MRITKPKRFKELTFSLSSTGFFACFSDASSLSCGRFNGRMFSTNNEIKYMCIAGAGTTQEIELLAILIKSVHRVIFLDIFHST